jgi:hypothetical protein
MLLRHYASHFIDTTPIFAAAADFAIFLLPFSPDDYCRRYFDIFHAAGFHAAIALLSCCDFRFQLSPFCRFASQLPPFSSFAAD